jgi:CRISPR/Cas system Type II protein with McrA/HNH and RuvC-like nuclease domain
MSITVSDLKEGTNVEIKIKRSLFSTIKERQCVYFIKYLLDEQLKNHTYCKLKEKATESEEVKESK